MATEAESTSGKNGIRKHEKRGYGPGLNWLYGLAYPGDRSASDITRRAIQQLRDGGNIVFDHEGPGPLSRLQRSKSKLMVTSGFSLDLFDGIRARRNNESSQEGAMLDLAADRFGEVFIGTNTILRNWEFMGHEAQQSEAAQNEFLDLLMIPTATTLPTIAAAQGRMLDRTIPEESPTGGSRFDRVLNLSLAFRASLKGNYQTSNMYLHQMLTGVQEAYAFRSKATDDKRTDPNNPNTFAINDVQIDPQSPADKHRRDEIEKWIHFVGFLDKTVAYVTGQMHKRKIDPLLIE